MKVGDLKLLGMTAEDAQANIDLFGVVREVIDLLKEIDPLRLEVTIQQRENIELELKAKVNEPGVRYGMKLTQLLKVIQRLRDECLAAAPNDKEAACLVDDVRLKERK